MQKLDAPYSVALLIQDMQVAHSYSGALRKLGIIAQVFNDLKTFWSATLDLAPDLTIVDVRLMSDGHFILKNHPGLKERRMNLVFYCPDAARPLLNSTDEIAHLGILNSSRRPELELKSIFTRLEAWMELQNKWRMHEGEQSKVQQTNFKLVSSIQVLKRESDLQKILLGLGNSLLSSDTHENFHGSCLRVFSSWDIVRKFSFYELNPNQQKLISPHYTASCYEQLPALWPGRVCHEGLDPLAQSLVRQVALDLFGLQTVILKVHGKRPHPEMLITLSVEEDFFETFPWDELEKYLTGAYAQKSYHQGSKEDFQRDVITPFEFIGLVYQHYQGALGNKGGFEEPQVMDVHLAGLMELMESKTQNTFHYKNFFEDFFAEVQFRVKEKFKLTCFGLGHISFLVNGKKSDEFFRDLKRVVREFPYWRYFEDPDAVLSRQVVNDVLMLPLSPDAYLKQVAYREGTTPLRALPRPRKDLLPGKNSTL